MKLLLSLCLVTASLLLVGCEKNRNLKITEVMSKRVELHLDEPSNNQFHMGNVTLEWVSQDPGAQPVRGALGLGSPAGIGAIQGRQFLVIFEDLNYAGPPVAQDFRPNIPGIKVRDGFFPNYGNDPRVSMRVFGESSRFSPVQERTSDEVRFGPSPRTSLGSSFNENGSLNGAWPRGFPQNRTISRAFSGSTPVDTDSEGDWSLRDRSDGVATPP